MSVMRNGESTETPEAASLQLLTDSQEEFLLRDLTVQTSNNENTSSLTFTTVKFTLSFDSKCN